MKAKMNNYTGWVNCVEPDILFGYYENLLINSGFKIVDTTQKFFYPFGFTALFLLTESHFAIHTFPEEGVSYIELSSCIDEPYENFMKNKKDNLGDYKSLEALLSK